MNDPINLWFDRRKIKNIQRTSEFRLLVREGSAEATDEGTYRALRVVRSTPRNIQRVPENDEALYFAAKLLIRRASGLAFEILHEHLQPEVGSIFYAIRDIRRR